ncbi:RWD domain-containing protein 4-like isoform X2 [Acanthaster planci]|uniref:RWD domain-containing protein 4-like isoform X2 n=1 Tax=Acanthaster planci TaxID=133434 RepID=A0A8B7Y1A6_ACAPL|nr:RWD domain-containing protein 4-like isoform X2 [Acanthaster planci]
MLQTDRELLSIQGTEGHYKSFLLEIRWGDNYPDEMPDINLDAFYNHHLQSGVRCSVVEKIKAEAEQWLGSAMTYTLFEWAKENADDLMSEQTEEPPEIKEDKKSTPESVAASKTKEKKEILTKAQKRKLANRTDYKGEMPRGWNWVDVVKHLSKTGQGKQQSTNS